MKVKIARENGTYTYYNYTSGHLSNYSLTQGNGIYTITLYYNVSGNKYKVITNTTVKVKMKNKLVPYLVSTDEITFSKQDTVGK